MAVTPNSKPFEDMLWFWWGGTMCALAWKGLWQNLLKLKKCILIFLPNTAYFIRFLKYCTTFSIHVLNAESMSPKQTRKVGHVIETNRLLTYMAQSTSCFLKFDLWQNHSTSRKHGWRANLMVVYKRLLQISQILSKSGDVCRASPKIWLEDHYILVKHTFIVFPKKIDNNLLYANSRPFRINQII